MRFPSRYRWWVWLLAVAGIVIWGKACRGQELKTAPIKWRATFTAPVPAVASWSIQPAMTAPDKLVNVGGNGVQADLPPGDYVLTGVSKSGEFEFTFTYKFKLTGTAPIPAPMIKFVATPSQIQTGQYAKLSATVTPATAVCTLDGKPVTLTSGAWEQIVTPEATASYTFGATSPGGPTTTAKVTVTVGAVPPPNPPVPTPGLYVLIVEETDQRGQLPAGQREILLATAAGSVREYLSTHCVKEGTQPAYRILDKDDSLTKESKTWQEVWARPRASVPWIAVSNGKDGYEGPLPQTAAECLTLLKKYGGQ